MVFDTFFDPIGFDVLAFFSPRLEMAVGQRKIIFCTHLPNIEYAMAATELDDFLGQLFLPEAGCQAGRGAAKPINV